MLQKLNDKFQMAVIDQSDQVTRKVKDKNWVSANRRTTTRSLSSSEELPPLK